MGLPIHATSAATITCELGDSATRLGSQKEVLVGIRKLSFPHSVQTHCHSQSQRREARFSCLRARARSAHRRKVSMFAVWCFYFIFVRTFLSP